ncbi:MAG TPA: hypothetical protein VKX33_01555 [Cyclobacteriaceae bacterium]|nr:hypothetical protein [Cyclobacteriaceae bacterium]
METSKINSKQLETNKAIMQIQLDQNDPVSSIQDLKEYASILSSGLGYDTAEILEEMATEDLNHMVVVFKKYFSDYIELLETDHVIAPKSTKD